MQTTQNQDLSPINTTRLLPQRQHIINIAMFQQQIRKGSYFTRTVGAVVCASLSSARSPTRFPGRLRICMTCSHRAFTCKQIPSLIRCRLTVKMIPTHKQSCKSLLSSLNSLFQRCGGLKNFMFAHEREAECHRPSDGSR